MFFLPRQMSGRKHSVPSALLRGSADKIPSAHSISRNFPELSDKWFLWGHHIKFLPGKVLPVELSWWYLQQMFGEVVSWGRVRRFGTLLVREGCCTFSSHLISSGGGHLGLAVWKQWKPFILTLHSDPAQCCLKFKNRIKFFTGIIVVFSHWQHV